MRLFCLAAKQGLATKSNLAAKSVERFDHLVATLTDEFGGRLVCDIDANDVAALQHKRSNEGKAARTVNYEIGVLRQILKARGLWGALSDRVRTLRERQDVGRSISREDETKLLGKISDCRSPAMLPLFMLAIDSGLRASEVRALRRSDLTLKW